MEQNERLISSSNVALVKRNTVRWYSELIYVLSPFVQLKMKRFMSHFFMAGRAYLMTLLPLCLWEGSTITFTDQHLRLVKNTSYCIFVTGYEYALHPLNELEDWCGTSWQFR